MNHVSLDYNHYDDHSDIEDGYDRNGLMSPSLVGDYDEPSPTESEPRTDAGQTPTTYTHSGGSGISPKGKITQWSADQCADYIASLGLEQYADAFVEEVIDGEALVALLHEDLKDLGVASIGHRLTILKNVYEVKRRQDVLIEPDHYIPLSAESNAPDTHATQDDVARIINQIKLRDERLIAAEQELRQLKDELNRVLEDSKRLREDVLPVIRMAKNQSQPLPTPDGIDPPPLSPNELPLQQKSSGNLSRRFSTKKLWLGANAGKMPSPTIHDSSSLDPSAAAMAASSHLTASMSSAGSNTSPYASQQTSPTSPPANYTQSTNIASRMPRDDGPRTARHVPDESYHERDRDRDRDRDRERDRNTRDGPPSGRRLPTSSTTDVSSRGSTQNLNDDRPPRSSRPTTADGGSSSMNSGTAGELMKSFRVSMDEPCHKVLPVALKKYQIDDDWRQYSLYIVYGDRERCLGLEEKPLILFKQLANEGRKPMFMLRKHAAPLQGFAQQAGSGDGLASGSGGRGGGGSSGSIGGGGGGGFTTTSVPHDMNGRVQSYQTQTPGGLL